MRPARSPDPEALFALLNRGKRRMTIPPLQDRYPFPPYYHFITSEVLYQLSYVGAGWILACGQPIVPICPGLSREMFQRCSNDTRITPV